MDGPPPERSARLSARLRCQRWGGRPLKCFHHHLPSQSPPSPDLRPASPSLHSENNNHFSERVPGVWFGFPEMTKDAQRTDRRHSGLTRTGGINAGEIRVPSSYGSPIPLDASRRRCSFEGFLKKTVSMATASHGRPEGINCHLNWMLATCV